MKIFVPTAAQCKLVTIYDSCIRAFLNYNSLSGVCWVSEPGSADIIVLFEEWGTRFLHYSDVLAEDPLFKAYWDRIFTINSDDLGRGFLPGCYTSLTQANFDPQLHRASAYPYIYNELLTANSHREKTTPEWLFSFRGTDLSHPIRKKLFHYFKGSSRAKMVQTRKQFHRHSTEDKREYVKDILLSKFVLCPHGPPQRIGCLK